MSTYYISASEHHYTIREIDPEDSWDSGDFGLDVSLTECSLSGRSGAEKVEAGGYRSGIFDVEDVPVGETAYVLLVNYTDGGTFGSDGYWCVPGIYASQEAANAAQKRAEGANDTKMAYRPWDGYFASLNSAEVVPMTVQA